MAIKVVGIRVLTVDTIVDHNHVGKADLSETTWKLRYIVLRRGNSVAVVV